MNIVKIDLEDGRGDIEVVVADPTIAYRLRRFCIDAAQRLRDAERWVEIEKRMTFERAGPHYGWCISNVELQGDSPAEAVDAAIAHREAHTPC